MVLRVSSKMQIPKGDGRVIDDAWITNRMKKEVKPEHSLESKDEFSEGIKPTITLNEKERATWNG
jgi:hypothetical protein